MVDEIAPALPWSLLVAMGAHRIEPGQEQGRHRDEAAAARDGIDTASRHGHGEQARDEADVDTEDHSALSSVRSRPTGCRREADGGFSWRTITFVPTFTRS